jgi:hypothetical protein
MSVAFTYVRMYIYTHTHKTRVASTLFGVLSHVQLYSEKLLFARFDPPVLVFARRLGPISVLFTALREAFTGCKASGA